MAVLRRIMQVRGAVHRHQRHTQALGPVGCFVLGKVADPGREAPPECGDLFRGDGELQPVVLEGVQPVRLTQQFSQPAPVGAAGHVEVNETVGAREKRRGAGLVVVGAVAVGRHLPGNESPDDAVGAGGQHRVCGNVDGLAVAVVQAPEKRGRHAERGFQPRFVVGQEPARPLQRRLGGVRVAGRVVPQPLA